MTFPEFSPLHGYAHMTNDAWISAWIHWNLYNVVKPLKCENVNVSFGKLRQAKSIYRLYTCIPVPVTGVVILLLSVYTTHVALRKHYRYVLPFFMKCEKSCNKYKSLQNYISHKIKAKGQNSLPGMFLSLYAVVHAMIHAKYKQPCVVNILDTFVPKCRLKLCNKYM